MRLGLRPVVLVLLLAGIAPATVLLVVETRANFQHVREAARAEVTAMAQLVAEQHQRSVDTARGTLLAIARLPSVRTADSRGCVEALSAIGTATDLWANLGAVFPDGRMFCSAFPQPGPINLADRDFFKNAVRTGGVAAGTHVISKVRRVGAFGFAYPVRDDEGRVVAVTFASLRTDTLQGQLERLSLPPRVSVQVVDRAGVVVTRRDAAGEPEELFGPEITRFAMEGEQLREATAEDGSRRVFAFAPIEAADGTAMWAVAAVPTDVVEEPVRSLAWKTLGAWAIAIVAILLGTGFIAEYVLLRRLRALTGAAARLAAGDYRARSGLRAGRDELGDFVGAFDHMAESLEEFDRQGAERRRLEEELRQAQKMEAVGQLAGGVAHDFNNLLTTIIGCARMVQESIAPNHPAQPDVTEILSSADRAAQLTRQLLAFARRQRLAPRAMDLRESVVGMERMLRRTLGETITLRVEVPDEPVVIRADPGQIEMVVLNLALNARDAMPGGGDLVIQIARDDAGEPAAGGEEAALPGPVARLTVRDRGTGMDAETRERIFEPFFTTKPAGKGTGLGLATVYGIVKQSGGLIRVRSSPGDGTEFRVILPLRPDDGVATPPPRPVAAGGSERVLLLEDDDVLRALVRRALTGAGYGVVEAPRPSVAIQRVAEDAFDLLVTDMVLPERSGWDLYRELAATRPGLKVLVMSGFAAEAAPEQAAIPADVPFLAKPFAPHELLAKVRQALDGAPPAT